MGIAVPNPVAPSGSLRKGRTVKLWTWAALGVICLLAFGLRAYRLDEQSIWQDEYPNVVNITAPSAISYVRLIGLVYPEQSQGLLFYFLEYYWAKVAGTSPEALRLLPILLSILGVPLAWLFGSYLWGPWTGLVAALCIAMSPQHIWYGQEIRPYGLLTPLTLLSLYGFLRGMREQRPGWWVMAACANMFLVWTHAFALIVTGIEALFVLLFWRRYARRAVPWAALQCAILIPWAVWMTTMPYSNEHPAPAPRVTDIVREIVFDDIVNIHVELLPSWKTNSVEEVPPSIRKVLPWRRTFDGTLGCILGLGALWLVIRALLRLGSRWNQPATTRERHTEDAVLLALVLLVPGTVLGVLNIIFLRPFLSPMYPMYNTVALYLVMGMFVQWMRPAVLRPVAFIVVAVLYGYQCAVFLPDVTRTNWKATAEYIASNAVEHDLVLDCECTWPTECLKYYLNGRPLDVRRITSFQAACDYSAWFLRSPVPKPSSSVWLAYERCLLDWLFPRHDIPAGIREGLASRGLKCSMMQFFGHRNVVLFRIQVDDTFAGTVNPMPVPPPVPIDYDGVLQQFGVATTDSAAYLKDLNDLRDVIGFWWPPLNKVYFTVHALDLVERGNPELGEAAARRLIADHPQFGLAHFALGVALATQNDFANALTCFDESFRLHRGLGEIAGPFVQSFCVDKDRATALEEAAKLEGMGFPFVSALKMSLLWTMPVDM